LHKQGGRRKKKKPPDPKRELSRRRRLSVRVLYELKPQGKKKGRGTAILQGKGNERKGKTFSSGKEEGKIGDSASRDLRVMMEEHATGLSYAIAIREGGRRGVIVLSTGKGPASPQPPKEKKKGAGPP